MQKSILVVEDDADIRQLIDFNLAREGYEVTCVEGGEEGLDLIKNRPPDLVVLDLMLPGIDGLETCRAIKSNPQTEHIPVIIVSAKSEDVDVVVGLEIGAEDYITKPFSPKVLVARIRALLRRREKEHEAPEGPVRIHDLQINPDRYEVTADGQPVYLSYTEFHILLLLARSAGRVFSRYQIVNDVRGEDSIVTDRSVDVHIAGVRKKLGKYADYIETVRGLGYRFRAQ
jgi:two-component system phosphate regulon response regulator PhoB